MNPTGIGLDLSLSLANGALDSLATYNMYIGMEAFLLLVSSKHFSIAVKADKIGFDSSCN